jgi:hypothetical protein
MPAMSHSEFTHILSSIDALSPDQVRQLLRALESRVAATEGQPSPAPLTGAEAADSPGQRAESHKPIWEVIEEENRSIPPEVWDDLPTDLAAQHDHYIYGTPKRPDA